MKRVALTLSVLGIFLLFALGAMPPRAVSSLESVVAGTTILYEGVVTRESFAGGLHILSLGPVRVTCHCKGSFQNKHVRVTGIVQSFEGTNQISAYTIDVID